MGKPIDMKQGPEDQTLSQADYEKFVEERQAIANRAGAADAELKALYKTYEKKGLHKQAAQLTDKLKKLESGARADYILHLKRYIDWDGLDAQGDLLDREAAE